MRSEIASPQSFPKAERLRKRSDYLRVQQVGRKVHAEYFLLLLTPGQGAPRVGVTVSSKVGNAVERNRLKRWIREFVRRHRGDLPAGDCVIVAKTSAAAATHEAVDHDLARLVTRSRRGA